MKAMSTLSHFDVTETRRYRMHTQPLRHLAMRWLFVLFAMFSIAACASGPEVVDHAFSFDTRVDNQNDVEVLDYRYGDSKLPVRAAEENVKAGKQFMVAGVHGPMLRGSFLYVKWRIKTTGQVYEDTVDLRNRLPADITDCRIHFLVRGPQLYVYLITPKKRAKDEPPNGPEMYDYKKTLTIYPDQVKP